MCTSPVLLRQRIADMTQERALLQAQAEAIRSRIADLLTALETAHAELAAVEQGEAIEAFA